MAKRIMILACVVDDDGFMGLNQGPTTTDAFIQFASDEMCGEDTAVGNLMCWASPEDFIADHKERGPITVAYLEGDDDATPAEATPAFDLGEPAASVAMTRDLGIAMRDFMEGHPFHVLKEEDGDLNESDHMRDVQFVDVGDPDNPVFHLDNGQTFTVRIFA